MTTARLRPSIHVAPVDSGVAFLGLDDSFVLSGNAEAIWTVWQAVASPLERGVDLAELLGAARNPSVRGLLETLITQLTAHDMVISPTAGPNGQKHPDGEKFAEVFGFLEAVAPDPDRSCAALRAASVAVTGPADLVFAATRTLARSAVGRIDAIVTEGEPLEIGRLARYVSLDGIDLAVRARRVPDVLITTPATAATRPPPGPGGDFPAGNRPHPDRPAGNRPHPDRPAGNHPHPDRGPRRFEVQVRPDFAAIAAVATPGHTSGVEPGWADRLGPEEHGPPASPVLLTLAASTAAHQAVLWIAGLPTQAGGRLVLGIDAVDLATTVHRVPPGSADRDAASSESRYDRPPDSRLPADVGAPADPTPEERLAAASALTDERFGLLRPPHPQALIQVPLALALCGEADGALGDGALGVAETGEYARLDALQAAVRSLPGPRPDGSAKARCVSTGQLVATDPPVRWVVAAGPDLRQLLGDGLARLLVAQATDARRFESIAVAPAADPQAWRWMKTMSVRWGHQVRLRRWRPPELPGWVVVGAQAKAGRDRPLAGWTAGPDEAACVRTALIRICGAAQALRDPAAPPLPDPISATDVTWPDLDAAITALAAAQHRLVLVPSTFQPAVPEAGILLAHAGMTNDRP